MPHPHVPRVKYASRRALSLPADVVDEGSTGSDEDRSGATTTRKGSPRRSVSDQIGASNDSAAPKQPLRPDRPKRNRNFGADDLITARSQRRNSVRGSDEMGLDDKGTDDGITAPSQRPYNPAKRSVPQDADDDADDGATAFLDLPLKLTRRSVPEGLDDDDDDNGTTTPSQPQNKSSRRSVPEGPENGDGGGITATDEIQAGAATTRRGNRRRSFTGQTEMPTRQSARSKKARTKAPYETVSEEQEHVEENPNEEFDQEIEETAYLLSSIDQQAHAEAQVLDANRLCSELLVPLALPWNYPEQALDATTPLDLDDLPMLNQADLGDNEISRSMVEATDVDGVMHLSSVVVHPSFFRTLNCLVPSVQELDTNQSIAGTMALNQYQAVAARRRKMNELESTGITPLYLIAAFPWSTTIGKSQRGPDAIDNSRDKDSCGNHWPPVATVVDGLSTEREWFHRRCLLSSEKGINNAVSKKVSQSTARKSAKIQLVARVSVRINGKLVSTDDSAVKKSIRALVKHMGDSPATGPASSYTEAELDEILQVGSSESGIIATGPLPGHMQCSLNSDALFQNASRDLTTVYRRGDGINAVRRLRQPLCLSIQSDYHFLQEKGSGSARTVGFQPPYLDCFGTVDGLLRVSCTRDGSFSASAEDSKELSFVALQECAIKYNRCFVCWGSCERAPSARCSVCCISVHVNCVRPTGETENKWVCSACKAGSNSKSNNALGRCSRCPLPSGLLKTVGSTEMHHLCATWGDETLDNDSATCCLCSSGKGSLLECVADGCQVKFHPSCAALASAFGDINHSRVGDDDAHLCSQYTLALVEASTMGNNERARLPIAFCGYHNPKRSEMFLGLYPEGCYLDPYHETTPALRIPPRRSARVLSHDEGNDSE